MVSWHDLAFGLLAFLSFGAVGFGLLMIFAGGMSSAPAQGSRVTSRGFRMVAVGLVLLIASCAKVLS